MNGTSEQPGCDFLDKAGDCLPTNERFPPGFLTISILIQFRIKQVGNGMSMRPANVQKLNVF